MTLFCPIVVRRPDPMSLFLEFVVDEFVEDLGVQNCQIATNRLAKSASLRPIHPLIKQSEITSVGTKVLHVTDIGWLERSEISNYTVLCSASEKVIS